MKKLLVASVASAALVAGSMVVASAANADSGTVIRIIDGDTLVVSINNGDHTIRLLNIDTPETKDPNQPVECLGPQAAEYLERLLPQGTRVRLEFDAERHDKYGRTLAGVFTPDGSLVNANIAREGMGIPVQFGGNSKFMPPVEAAYAEARAAKSGLFSDQVDCTIPAQLAQTTKALETAAAAEPATTSTAAGAVATALVTELAAAKALRAVLAASKDAQRAIYWAGLTATVTVAYLSTLDNKVAAAEKKRDDTKSLQVTLASAEKKALEDRLAAEAQAAAEKKAAEERAAAEKKAADDAAAANAAAAEAARQAEAERQRRLPAPAPYVPPAPQPYIPPAPAPYVPPATKYTGPRCYAPGGKSWRPC
ncbi:MULTISPECIES: thermonuclease family protein [unclassified Arthrobacter]|uniref:thermonuclease family protein n=1 Tax=unclassified Arthrobacter TaxID=235627 RepID=UPI003397A79C